MNQIDMLKTYSENPYSQRALQTNLALQANIAAGGERERQAWHALHIAENYEYFHRCNNKGGCDRILAQYNQYCERIGFDPMTETLTI